MYIMLGNTVYFLTQTHSVFLRFLNFCSPPMRYLLTHSQNWSAVSPVLEIEDVLSESQWVVTEMLGELTEEEEFKVNRKLSQ